MAGVAQIEATMKAALDNGDDVGIVDGDEAEDEDDEVPWCR